ncbi:arylesterase [Pseudopontixanthobacter vadosimaris]|uniref:arylesterase n=1 Tax=Pseudopontixanthobacter vadosimaris TaxID=2726450 RepID=UPI001F0FD383|nr:arylesterase [Pseudopontixanthobacter vadosimaris]
MKRRLSIKPHHSAATALLPICLALSACGAEAEREEAVTAASAEDAAAGTMAAAEMPVMGPQRNVLAFGNSLFAGYNVDRQESYPARLEAALRARGINARVANAGVSGDTTAAGRQRLAFTLDAQENPPELVILELGGNDLLRGIEPAETRANLEAMLKELQSREIPVLLMGMVAPPNYGPEFQQAYDAIYPELAERYGADLVPFFLEPVYQRPDLIQADRIHPTAQGIEALVAATLDEVAVALPAAAAANNN